MLLERTDDETLRRLISPSARELLAAIEPGILSGDRLRQFIRESRTSRDYLADPVAREVLIGALPHQKAVELCSSLGIANYPDPYLALRQATIRAGSRAEELLLTFFGASGERAERHAGNHVAQAAAQYPLFPHQRTAARKVRSGLENPPRRLVLHMPTGGGKTRTTMNVIAEHLREHEPTVVLWLAYSGELLEQAASEFVKAWSSLGNREVDICRFWGNTLDDPLRIRDGIVVAGLGKLHAWSRRHQNGLPTIADRTTLTVMDEAHQAIAATYADMLDVLATKRRDAKLLGLTATPGRTWSDIIEDVRLADFFGKKKVGLEIEGFDNPVTYLIESGYLARPTFRTLNVRPGFELSEEDLDSLVTDADISPEILSRLAGDQARNLKIIAEAELLLRNHRRVILFTATVGQAELMAAVLKARGYQAEAVTGATREYERRSILQRYVSAAPAAMAICNFGVLTTGFDAPGTSAALIARPTRSLVLFSQMVGRAIRGPLAGGNDKAEVVTVIDPQLPGFGDVAEAFGNWEDVWQRQ
ncbi:DEAD/DEAH box helicase family protein [Micromonospora sp. DR5-3]|nr:MULTISPECIES: DEAD/DEAH box helicase family protein [unclassified Micromonospora]MCW3817842.1 DEAD/DEAH box helicase family protein [Micromonospora sp. DR5-3]